MSDTLDSALVELLGTVNGGMQTAGEFLLAELPDVVQQLLLWHGVSNLVYMVMALLLLASLPKQGRYAYELVHKMEDDSDQCFAGGAVLAALGIEFITLLAMLNMEWLQIYLAPKVWLLEYAAALTSKVT